MPAFFTLITENRLIDLDLDILRVFCSEIHDARLHNQVTHEHSQEFREGVPHGFREYEPWTDSLRGSYRQKHLADGKCSKCPYPLDPRSKRFCRKHLMKEAENRDTHAARNPDKCRNCKEKRDSRSKRFCTFHLMKERERDHKRDVLRWQTQKENAAQRDA